MKVIRQASDVADVADPVIREFLARRINHMVTVWAPDLWPDFGQLLVLVDADRKLTHRGCGQKLGLVYAVSPRLSRYSRGLRKPREILMRFSLYQRM